MLKKILVLAAPNARETEILKATLDDLVVGAQVFILQDCGRARDALPIIQFLKDGKIKEVHIGVMTPDEIIKKLKEIK